MTTRPNFFRETILAAKSSGFGYLSDKTVSRATFYVSRAYLLSALVVLALSYVLVLSIFQELSERVLPNIPLLNMNTYALVLILFYIVKKDRIIVNFQNLIELEETICSHYEEKDSFYGILRKYSKLANRCVRYTYWYNLSMVSADIFIKILCRLHIIDINGKNYLLHEVPFNATSTEVFWPTFTVQASCLHLVVVTQMFNDLYMINVTIFLAVSFIHLRFKLGNILLASENLNSILTKMEDKPSSEPLSITDNYFCNQNEDFYEIGPKVKQWVESHAQLLRLCNEFSQLYNPVLLAFFANKFINVCFGMFMITQGESNVFNGFETVTIISYFLGNAMCLLVLCIAGTHLMHESIAVFDEAFHCPWYRCLPSTKASLSVVACVAHRPVRLTVLCSVTAEMSLGTFNWVFKAMVSYYITLTQLKRQFSNEVKV